jgi:hypothetical protein
MDISHFEKKIYSQNGEDGILINLIESLYDKDYKGNFVEFGVETGIECNTRILKEKYKWFGLQMDGSNEDITKNLYKHFVTKDNILDLFEKYNVPPLINLLSVDIDYNDFYVLKEILKKYTSDIIICEYNATHLPDQDKIVVYNELRTWDRTNYFGCSLLSLKKLLNDNNYSLIYCESKGINAFFIHNEILKSKNLNFKNIDNINLLYRYPKYGTGPNGGHKQDPLNRQYITYNDTIQTPDEEQCA